MSPSKKKTWNLAQKYIKMGAPKQEYKKCDSGYSKEPTSCTLRIRDFVLLKPQCNLGRNQTQILAENNGLRP